MRLFEQGVSFDWDFMGRDNRIIGLFKWWRKICSFADKALHRLLYYVCVSRAEGIPQNSDNKGLLGILREGVTVKF